MFKQLDKQNILSDFPNVKLSYENIIHKSAYIYRCEILYYATNFT
jgi:hypothetical protein